MNALAVNPVSCFGCSYVKRDDPNSVASFVKSVKQNEKIRLVWKLVEERFGEKIIVQRVPRSRALFGGRMEFFHQNLMERDPKILPKLSKPTILIADDLNPSAQKMAIVFEILNLRFIDQYARMESKAAQGLITKEKYVEETADVEKKVTEMWLIILKEFTLQGIIPIKDIPIKMNGPQSGLPQDEKEVDIMHQKEDEKLWEKRRQEGLKQKPVSKL